MSRYEHLTDEQLIEHLRASGESEAEACRNELYSRVYPSIARWCLRLSGNREEAADLAQDVVFRVHQQLDSFRLESKFSTWLYTVTRRTALNRMQSERRHRRNRIDNEKVPEAADTGETALEGMTRTALGERLRATMTEKLEPMEAQVVYMHYVQGMTLPAITQSLGLTNKSGSKALLVGGMRKLRRHLGPWLQRQFAV